MTNSQSVLIHAPNSEVAGVTSTYIHC